MNIEKYTQNAQQAVMDCQNIAISHGHQMLDGEHLHLALLQQRDGLIPKLLKYMNVEAAQVAADIEAELAKLPKVSGGADSMYSSRRLSQLLMRAEQIAEEFKDEGGEASGYRCTKYCAATCAGKMANKGANAAFFNALMGELYE